MPQTKHPVEPEELMAYHDGEPAPGVAEHLERCPECQRLAADLRGVSTKLADWRLVPSSPRVAQGVLEAAERPRRGKRRLWMWVPGLAAALVVVVGILQVARPPEAKMVRVDPVYAERIAPRTVDFARAKNELADGAQVVQTAQLSMTVASLDESRTALDAILQRHDGYLARLTTQSATPPRAFDATLRVPAAELAPTLAEVRQLGRIESESQTADDVTRQSTDLDARLANARATEKRLTTLLDTRTGDLDDVLSIEKELARVRGEIESMEAERRSLTNRVEFATIDLTLTEEGRAALPGSTASRLRNAALQGYRTMLSRIVAVVQSFLSYGPSLLLWAAILFWPARAVWRRLQQHAR